MKNTLKYFYVQKRVWLYGLFMLVLGGAWAQNSIPGENISFALDPTPNTVAVPSPITRPIPIGTRSVQMSVDFTGSAAAQAAFDEAVTIWETKITSDEVIRVEATFTALDPGILAVARPAAFFRNFTPGQGESANFESDTWYPSALADKIAKSDQDPGNPDIIIQLNSDLSWINQGQVTWHFDPSTTPGNNQLDFTTAALRALGTGLGFRSSAAVSGNSGTWGELGDPFIYDLFVEDGSGNEMILFNSPSGFLKNFYESGDLFFTGPNAFNANGGNLFPRLNSPSNFSPNVSVSFFSTFPQTRLMRNGQAIGAQILSPDDVDLGLLDDLGWDLDLSTGIEDDLLIDNGQEMLIEGGNFFFSSTFYDSHPLGDYIVSADWEIELFHETGSFIYKSETMSYTTNWSGQVGYLPFGYTWLRNDNGSIRGKVSVSALDNDGVTHEDSRQIGVEFQPDAPKITVHPQSGTEVTISFYSPGASDYHIYYDTNTGVPYAGTGLPQGNSPISVNYEQNTVTFTNLSSGTTYYFNVIAENSYGMSGFGGEVVVPINCTAPSAAFSLTNCQTQGYPLNFDANATNNDANPGDIFYLFVYSNNTNSYTGHYGYGSIGTFDLLDVEQRMTRYYGSSVNFTAGTYNILLYYYKCGSMYAYQKSLSIAPPGANCNGGGGGNGTARQAANLQAPLSFDVFPNPTQEWMTIRYSGVKADTKASLKNIAGQTLETFPLEGTEGALKVNVSKWPAGIYLVSLQTQGQGNISKKLTITP